MKTKKYAWHDDNDGAMVFYEATIFLDDIASADSVSDCVELDIHDRDGEEVLVDDETYEALCQHALNLHNKQLGA